MLSSKKPFAKHHSAFVDTLLVFDFSMHDNGSPPGGRARSVVDIATRGTLGDCEDCNIIATGRFSMFPISPENFDFSRPLWVLFSQLPSALCARPLTVAARTVESAAGLETRNQRRHMPRNHRSVPTSPGARHSSGSARRGRVAPRTTRATAPSQGTLSYLVEGRADEDGTAGTGSTRSARQNGCSHGARPA